MSQAEEILLDLGKILKSTLIINPELKIFASEKDNFRGNLAPRRMFNYIVRNCRDKLGENKNLRRLSNLNEYSRYFPIIKGFYLEHLLGYQRLK